MKGEGLAWRGSMEKRGFCQCEPPAPQQPMESPAGQAGWGVLVLPPPPCIALQLALLSNGRCWALIAFTQASGEPLPQRSL